MCNISSLCSLELAQGRSYWNRLRYLDLCEIAMELFSKSYFCKHFLIQALELVSDPVANVRCERADFTSLFGCSTKTASFSKGAKGNG